jgi:acetyl esterase/lipase
MGLKSVGAPLRRWSALLLAAATVIALGGCPAPTPQKAAATPTASESSASTLSQLAYADKSPQQRLDLFLPGQTANPAPLVIWVHGGGWRTGDKSSITYQVNPSASPPQPQSCTDVVEVQVPDVAALTAKGYAVASLNYRLNREPVTAVQDAKAAVRFLRANAAHYHLDPDRFAVWGNSAGGYTVIMLGVTSGQRTVFDDPSLGNPDVPATVQAVVDWFGPTDSSSMPGNVGKDESPYTYIVAGRSVPPFMIAHGAADCTVPPEQSRHLYDALTKAGDAATLTILPGARHEDPAFMRTQRVPTVAFLDRTFNR